MKVLFVDQYSEMGGGQRCLLESVEALREAGGETHAAIPGDGPLGDRLKALGATLHPIELGRYALGKKGIGDSVRFLGEAPGLQVRLAEIANAVQPDLVYVNGPRVLPAAAGAVKRRWPLLFHCLHRVEQAPAAWFAGRSLRWADATVVSCCLSAAEPIREYVAPGRFHVVENSAPAPRKELLKKVQRGEGFRIGVVGRISPDKGQMTLVEAAGQLVSERADCRFVICGEALFGDPKVEKYARDVFERSRDLPVEFPGWRDDVYEVLGGLDLLVLPSLTEGMPLVVLEAFACGLPVAAFASGGVPEIIRDGENGFLVRPATAEALAARIAGLLEQPQLLQKAAARAQADWRERFTPERYRRRILEVMAAAAEPKEAARRP